MISYADLEKAFRQERAAPTLQKLPADFYADAKSLLENPDVGDFKESISQYLEKTFYIRANKIVHYAGRAAQDTKPPDNILQAEEPLYKDLLDAVARHKAALLDAKSVTVRREARPQVKVRILQALPAIAGSDSKEYGPFREDDVVELPEDSAALLIQRKIAERMG
ncbi:MAG: hypothetical protein V1875_10150 [Candidatus Altiarchaeota archaeon]